jgi:hypothetical protein
MVINGFQMDGALLGWGGSCVCLGHIIHVAGQMGRHVITITTTTWNVNGNPPKELPRHELDKPGFFFFFFFFGFGGGLGSYSAFASELNFFGGKKKGVSSYK